MSEVLLDGIPSLERCDVVLGSAIYRRMKVFSERFLNTNRSALRCYASKWGTENPLRSWSRRWEYPYVMERVAAAVRRKSQLRILDAGSGATFLPFHLRRCFRGAKVSCCDTDRTLVKVFASINETMDTDVDFRRADIRELPYDDRSFDFVYCVSVLEHTDDHEDSLREFARVLKPGGRLAITFDISLDGTRDLSPAAADALLKAFQGIFETPDAPSLYGQLASFDILTTETVSRDSLPWRHPAWSRCSGPGFLDKWTA